MWRPSNGTFYSVDRSGKAMIKQWGASTDIPVIGDYDGDGKTDFAVLRPSNGTWYVLQSSNGKQCRGGIGARRETSRCPATTTAMARPTSPSGDRPTAPGTSFKAATARQIQRAWGAPTDIPVPGDYDGDGKTDLAVWRPSNGTWYIIQSSNGSGISRRWGATTDNPVPGDYDGDGKTDFAVWRPSTGTWYIIQSSTGKEVTPGSGKTGDVPVSRDYDGDGKADFAVWRPSNWNLVCDPEQHRKDDHESVGGQHRYSDEQARRAVALSHTIQTPDHYL